MGRKRGNRSKYHPGGEMYHPRVRQLVREGDWDSVKLLAAFARSVGEQDHFAHRSDAQLASDLLHLQDAGLITLGADEDNEHVSITVHDSPEQAAAYREGWKPGDPS